jgi:hypothetical protein
MPLSLLLRLIPIPREVKILEKKFGEKGLFANSICALLPPSCFSQLSFVFSPLFTAHQICPNDGEMEKP